MGESELAYIYIGVGPHCIINLLQNRIISLVSLYMVSWADYFDNIQLNVKYRNIEIKGLLKSL